LCCNRFISFFCRCLSERLRTAQFVTFALWFFDFVILLVTCSVGRTVLNFFAFSMCNVTVHHVFVLGVGVLSICPGFVFIKLFSRSRYSLAVCADKLRLRSASIHLTISLHVACKGCNSICLFIRLRSLMIIFLSSRSSREVSSEVTLTTMLSPRLYIDIVATENKYGKPRICFFAFICNPVNRPPN